MARKPKWISELPLKYAALSNRELLDELCSVMQMCDCCSCSRQEALEIRWEQEAVYQAVAERLGAWLDAPADGTGGV